MKKILSLILVLSCFVSTSASDKNSDKKRVAVFVTGLIGKQPKDMIDNTISIMLSESGDYIVNERTSDFEEIYYEIDPYSQLKDPKHRELISIANQFDEDYVILVSTMISEYGEIYLGSKLIDVKNEKTVTALDTVVVKNIFTGLRNSSREFTGKFMKAMENGQ
ncbi:MAG: hypothetical protein J1E78_04170 [Muribaculaceae bacterium]|nr:hypothetical protein [Muribaculaceae bacterium]